MADNLTPFSNQCVILSDLWMNYRDDESFSDFIEYNDLGLPLAYAIANELAEVNDLGKELVEETFNLLLSGIGVEDEGFDSLDDLLDIGLPMSDE